MLMKWNIRNYHILIIITFPFYEDYKIFLNRTNKNVKVLQFRPSCRNLVRSRRRYHHRWQTVHPQDKKRIHKKLLIKQKTKQSIGQMKTHTYLMILYKYYLSSILFFLFIKFYCIHIVYDYNLPIVKICFHSLYIDM